MTETKEKITPLQNSEEHQKLVQNFEEEKLTLKSKAEEWKNAYLKSEQDKLTISKQLEREQEEKDDWKREAFSSRKVELEKKDTKNKNEFLEKFQELQATKE